MQAGEEHECPVCQTEKRDWRLDLPCGHPLCFDCLDLIMEEAYHADRQLTCPICRRPVPLGDTLFVQGAPHRQADLRHDMTLVRYICSGCPFRAARRRRRLDAPLAPVHRGLRWDGKLRRSVPAGPGIPLALSWRLEVEARLGAPSPVPSEPGAGSELEACPARPASV